MTFASKKTKSAVLSLLVPRLLELGYREHRRDQKTLRTEFRRRLNGDVTVGLQLEFFDGPIAAANRTHMQATFGIASRKLLTIYAALHGEQLNEEFLPISGSMRALEPGGNGEGWVFEIPGHIRQADNFLNVVADPLERLIVMYDSADKQIAQLLHCKDRTIHWNDSFFEPVAYLYLGQPEAARSAAARVLEGARTPAFAEAYRRFYLRVLQTEA